MRALITGITGQDGSYLAEQLTGDGWAVTGLVRGQRVGRREWLSRRAPGVMFADGDLTDAASLHRAVSSCEPDVIFHLGAQTSPAAGWTQPVMTADVTGLGALRMLDAVAACAPDAAVVVAGSLATHGPYGAAKTFARAICADYRDRGLRVSVAVFGGHHSPRRGPEFLARKVTRAVARIAAGKQSGLTLGPLNRIQDWGWAPDFMSVLPSLVTLPPDDYVISTGVPHSAQSWVQAAFATTGLDWLDHVTINESFGQPADVPAVTGQPDSRLDWKPRVDFADLVAWMVHEDMEGLR